MSKKQRLSSGAELIAVGDITASSFASSQKIHVLITQTSRDANNVLHCQARDFHQTTMQQLVTLEFRGAFAALNIQPGDSVKLEGEGIRVQQPTEQDALLLCVESDKCTVIVSKPQLQEEEEEILYFIRDGALEQCAPSAAGAGEEEDGEYVKLAQLQVGQHANLFGIVTNAVFPVKTKQETVRWSFRLVDDSLYENAAGVEVTIFQPSKNISLPLLVHGSIVRLHCVKTEMYNSNITLRSDKHTTMFVMPPQLGSRTAPVSVLAQEQSMAVNWNRVDELRGFFQSTILPTSDAYNQYTLLLKQVSSMPALPSGFVDLIVRVKTLPSHYLYSFEVEDVENGGGTATVRLGCFDNKDLYWPLVVRAVGAEENALIKIRNCQIQRTGNNRIEILAVESLTASAKVNRTTSFFLLDSGVPLPKAVFMLAPEPSVVVETSALITPPAALPIPPTSSLPTWDQRLLLTQVLANAATLPISTLRDALASNAQTRKPFRVRVNLVDHFPHQVSEFSFAPQQLLEDGSKYEWRFALLLEDLTARVEAYVVGEEGNAFFKLPACNLGENAAAHGRVAQCMQRIKHTPLSCMECVLVRIPETSAFAIQHTTAIMAV